MQVEGLIEYERAKIGLIEDKRVDFCMTTKAQPFLPVIRQK